MKGQIAGSRGAGAGRAMYKEVVDRIAELTTTAFGLVAALAWNAAIQGWFASNESFASGGPFVYAMLVTVIAVLATVWIGRIAARAARVVKDEDGDEEEEASPAE